MFSVSLLYASRDFLNLILEAGFTPEEFKLHFERFRYTSPDKILELTFKCGWAKISPEGVVSITSRGLSIVSLTYENALLLQLEDMILIYNPTWASLLPKGRLEAKSFLPNEVKQCFKEAGLFGDVTDEIVSFWDNLSNAYRNYTQKRKTEIGREGEKLSYEYEFKRTGCLPHWQSIESNLAGFDLLSVDNAGERRKLQIEVKASTSKLDYAVLHITKHEWQTAKLSLNYIFHLWLIDDSPKLFIIGVDDVEKHVPSDKGNGSWETVAIPFNVLVSSKNAVFKNA